jgi:hypothetical protein
MQEAAVAMCPKVQVALEHHCMTAAVLQKVVLYLVLK